MRAILKNNAKIKKTSSTEDNFDDVKKNNNQTLSLAATFQAIHNSIFGLKTAFVKERAFRQEIVLSCLLLPIAFWMPATKLETLFMVFSVILIWIVELLNSAIESTVDRISLSKNSLSKQAKDYGSAAVMIAVIFCVVVYFSVALKYYDFLF